MKKRPPEGGLLTDSITDVITTVRKLEYIISVLFRDNIPMTTVIVCTRARTCAVGQARIEQDEDIPLHTVRGWKDRGYRVKKGESGIICQLWRRNNTGKETMFYKTKGQLFTGKQVENGECDG